MYIPQVFCDDFFPENFYHIPVVRSAIVYSIFCKYIYKYIYLQKEELCDRLLGYLSGKVLAYVDRFPKQNSESRRCH